MMQTGGILLDPVLDGPQFTVQNESGLDLDAQDIIKHFQMTPEYASLSTWGTSGVTTTRSTIRNPLRRQGSFISRDKYVTPTGVYDEMRVAGEAAADDDVVAGVMESSTALAFSKIKFDVADDDQEDVWNQLIRTWDLDSRLREMWNDCFIYSQAVVGIFWGTKSFKVNGTTPTGKKKKKVFSGLNVPLGITLIDPHKVVPVGSFMFRNEKLLYMAEMIESQMIDDILAGKVEDPIVSQMFVQKYQPTAYEQIQISEVGVSHYGGMNANYYLLNPDNVFRHTETRPDYQKFAPIKFRQLFELLDMKNLIREDDRRHILASTNFIILVKKGSDRLPAKPLEMKQLGQTAANLGKIPMLVGDHRLSVEIITPKNDFTLQPDRYDLIDSRITARLYKLISTGGPSNNAGSRADTALTLARMVGKGLEGDRDQLKRFLERELFEKIKDRNVELDEDPELRFVPNKIYLEFDAAFASFMIQLRQMGEISRETILSEFDFDQDKEALWLTEEEENGYNEIFHTINPNNQGVPTNSSDPYSKAAAVPAASGTAASKSSSPTQSPAAAGASQGGLRNGGGASAGKGAGKSPRNVLKKSD